MSLPLNMAWMGAGAWALTAPWVMGAGAPAEPAPVPMVLIDEQLNAKQVGVMRLTISGGAGRAGEVVFVEEKPGAAPVRTTLAADRVVALASPGWIIDPLTTTIPAVAGGAEPSAAPATSDRNRNGRTNRSGTRSTTATVGPDQPVLAMPLNGFRPWIELTDGQRLPGSPGRPVDEPGGKGGADAQTFGWLSPRLGAQAYPLDVLSRVVLLPRPGAGGGQEPDTGSDLVVLANGDRVVGFVDAVGESVTVSPPKPAAKPGEPKAAPPEPTTVPIDQVAEIRLSNPRTPLRGAAVWLVDGSLVAARRLEIDAAARRVTLGGGSSVEPKQGEADLSKGASIDVGELRAVATDAGRVLAWSSLPIARQQGAGERRTFEPVVVSATGGALGSELGADDLLLPGPMSAEWTLPKDAVRMSAWLVMEERSWAWGDCQVTVSAVSADGAERVLGRGRLNASDPVLSVQGELGPNAARLRVTVDQGENGPVQDRVVVRHGLVLRGDAAGRGTPARAPGR